MISVPNSKPNSWRQQKADEQGSTSPEVSVSSQQPKLLATPGLSKNPFMVHKQNSSKFSVPGSPGLFSVSNTPNSTLPVAGRGRCASDADKLQFLHAFASPQLSPQKKKPAGNLDTHQLDEQSGSITLRNSVEEGPGRRLKNSKLFSMDFKRIEGIAKSGFVLHDGEKNDSNLNIQKKQLDSNLHEPFSGIWSSSKAEIGSKVDNKVKSEATSEKKASSSVTFGIPRRFKGMNAGPAISSVTIIESFMKDI